MNAWQVGFARFFLHPSLAPLRGARGRGFIDIDTVSFNQFKCLNETHLRHNSKIIETSAPSTPKGCETRMQKEPRKFNHAPNPSILSGFPKKSILQIWVLKMSLFPLFFRCKNPLNVKFTVEK